LLSRLLLLKPDEFYGLSCASVKQTV